MTVSLNLNNPIFIPNQPESIPQNSTWKDRIQKVPVIGHVIRAIIWLFKKTFACCFKPSSNIIAQSPILTVKTGPVSTQKIPPVVKEKRTTIESLLNLPQEIRIIVLKKLFQEDLEAFDVALTSRKTTDADYKKLHEAVKEILKVVTLQNSCEAILMRNPTWRNAANAWTKVSLEDKVWLLRLHEFCHSNLHIPQIKSEPCASSPNAISQRSKIEKFLASFTDIKLLEGRSFTTCPEFIYLLPNLQKLDLSNNSLTVAPDLRNNIHLTTLDLSNNKINIPPNVKHNKDLKILILADNQLTQSPDVSCNEKLRKLILCGNRITNLPNNNRLQALTLARNHLTVSPDFSSFKHLKYLHLDNNELTIPPNVSQNIALESLKLNRNQLTVSPDVSSNFNLKALDLRSNKLTESPNVTNNGELTHLYLSNNLLTVPPDVSQNEKLEVLMLGKNKLPQAPNLDKNIKLKELWLGNNQITQAPNISKNVNLVELNIENNPLSTIAKAYLRKLDKESSHLDIYFE